MESPEVIRIFNVFGESVVGRAMRNLAATRTINGRKRRAVSSGALRDSLTFSLKDNGKGRTYINFGAKGIPSKYADVVEEGRRPGKFPPIQAIKDWMRIKPIRLRDLKTNSFTKVTETKLNQAAFLIARSIKMKGIPGLKYFEDALTAQLEEEGDEFIELIAGELIARITPTTRTK